MADGTDGSALKKQLMDTIKAAMKGGEKERLGFARSLHAQLKQREVDERIELDDAAVIEIAVRSAKQRRESIEAAQTAGRAEMAEKEQRELTFIQEFLPAALSDEELTAVVEAAIEEAGASSPKDMGAVMKLVTPRTKGQADGKRVSTMVRELLAAKAG